VSSERTPDLNLFLDILRTLEDIDAPYMIVGAFAAIIYGSTRTTHDIDMVVDLSEEHIRALEASYPPPRFYADAEQMRDSIRMGIMFNIIDSGRGEKADLTPLTMDARYRRAFQRRIRQMITLPDGDLMQVWCARPEDVIVGKLMAWNEGRSYKHESDIFDVLVWHYLRGDSEQTIDLDEGFLTAQALSLGADVAEFWDAVRTAARREVGR
jgi:hypothetical protein